MTDTAESLDPLRLPLIGERLIEASAGTGKTFTIAALYLRLLLGLGGEAAYPRAISVEELLVVTFTEAATEELRGRIRSNIHELRIACLRGESDNPLYSALLAEI
ncbi:UvrD-helicase domain-containing protein, partial [Enterobacter hormaechei]|nr:UvrD-helicase domain-containing protein [Enterobacter hormaechei]